jgi:hypothetical protein
MLQFKKTTQDAFTEKITTMTLWNPEFTELVLLSISRLLAPTWATFGKSIPSQSGDAKKSKKQKCGYKKYTSTGKASARKASLRWPPTESADIP